MWPKRHCSNFHVEPKVFIVPHYTDDFRWLVVVLHVDDNAFTERVFTVKVFTHESFIDNNDVTHLASLVIGVESSPLQWNLHGPEIINVGHTNTRTQSVTRRAVWLPDNIDAGSGVSYCEWKRIYCSRGNYSRQSLKFAD